MKSPGDQTPAGRFQIKKSLQNDMGLSFRRGDAGIATTLVVACTGHASQQY
jgi:hypothetical protein